MSHIFGNFALNSKDDVKHAEGASAPPPPTPLSHSPMIHFIFNQNITQPVMVRHFVT